jgi:hypothetical protein
MISPGEEDPKREVVNVPLGPRSRVIVERIRLDTGIPKTEALTRILEWFASLDRKFRLAVLTSDPATREELARIALADMVTAEPSDTLMTVPLVTMMKSAQLLAERIIHIAGAVIEEGRTDSADGKASVAQRIAETEADQAALYSAAEGKRRDRRAAKNQPT